MDRDVATGVLAAGLLVLWSVACDEDDSGTVGGGGTTSTSSSSGSGTGGGDGGTGGTDADAGPGGSGAGGGGVPCPSYDSQEEEFSPVQTTGSGLPSGHAGISWTRPAQYIYLGAFSGTPGNPASHEGVDYVHDSPSVVTVDVTAAAAGQVVYVRLGCPQSTEFGYNASLRECGAGWGNHVVVDHGGGIVTRYAHLKPATTVVQVGDAVTGGQQLAHMGNSGRSDVRHLHFELGTITSPLDPCDHAQSFDLVYDSESLAW